MPQQSDIDWLASAVSLVRDGGVLGFPSSGLVYAVDRAGRKLKLTTPEVLVRRSSLETHQRTKCIAKLLDWEVI